MRLFSNTWVRTLIGAVLMVGGTWVSYNFHPEFYKKLEHQGIFLDLGKTVAYIGVFMILFPLLKSFFFDALSDAIKGRTSELEKTFSEAENLRSEMAQLRRDYEAKIQATEAEARETIQSQIREAQELRQQLMAEASAKADEMLRRAQEEIEAEKHKVLTELRLKAVDMTISAAEKLIGENMDTDRNRKLVDEFIEKVEVNG